MKTALVTGGSGEIGEAICRRLSEMGYSVAVGYNSRKDKAEEVCSKLVSAMPVFIDLADAVSVREAYEKTVIGSSHPEILINNAGNAHIGLFTDMDDDDIIRMMNVDLVNTMLLTKLAVPEMVRRHYGRIVNISSVWGECGASCEVVYSAAKAGIIGFTKALGKELAPSGITVNCIAPGMIDTKMNSMLSDEDKSSIVDDIPAGRMGSPEDIASLAAFLCSSEAGYITAQCIRVDGGWI